MTFHLFSIGIICGMAGILLWISWLKWPDVLVDFGQELYVALSISQGKVLYRDVFYFSAPFSAYWNGVCFKLFGACFLTLVYVNLFLLVILVFIMYYVLRHISSPLTAYLAIFCFISLFAFNQYVGIGNYNYLCPYAHEATHGMLFSWVLLACIIAYNNSAKPYFLFVAGLSMGFVFLTKPEFFVAAACAATTALMIWSWLKWKSLRLMFQFSGIFLSGFLLPPLLAILLLSGPLSLSEAISGTFGSWAHIWNSDVSNLPMYKAGMGTDHIRNNIISILKVGGAYTLFLLPAAALSLYIKSKKTAVAAGIAAAAVTTLILMVIKGSAVIYEAGKPLSLFMTIAGLALFWKLFFRSGENVLISVVTVVFALVLLMKIFLNSRIYHYGFVLAMPAMMILVAACFHWIPQAIKQRNGRPVIFICTAFTLFAFIIAGHLKMSQQWYAKKTFTVGSGSNTFRSDARGRFVKSTLDWLKQNTKMSDTVLVLPEGSMINFLSGRENPTPITNLTPVEMLMFSEQKITETIKTKSPDYIIFIHKDNNEFGYRFFGRDYGYSTMQWIQRNYKPVMLFGAMPLRDKRFGILIAKRKQP